MTIERVAGTDLEYFLLSYDKHGNERDDDPDAPTGKLSDLIFEKLKTQGITDVFFACHGWKGDVPAAKDQYDRWIGAMAACEEDRARIRVLRPGFNPLIVGLHWPSLPWGNERQEGAEHFSPDGSPLRAAIDDAADKTADSSAAINALNTIFGAAIEDIAPARLPSEVVAAYRVLLAEAGLEADGPKGPPGTDAEPFDPETAYQLFRESGADFGGGVLGGLLSPLRQVSFWKMKKRARTFGEQAAGRLLRDMQGSVSNDDGTRFHLMGHSFGCIAASATVSGSDGGEPIGSPVDSLFLVQGALSLWSFCADIPVSSGSQGYFHDIPAEAKVKGPVIATQSEHDTAVGKMYPLAAGAARQFDLAPGDLPKYGAMGAFGIRGPGIDVLDIDMGDSDCDYHFEPRKIYNLESSRYICDGRGFSGAHNDIAKPQVAHAFWQAVMT